MRSPWREGHDRLAPALLRRHAIPPPRSRVPSRMARVLAVITPLFLLVPAARTQQIDTTLWTRLRYRFVGPEGNRAVAVVGEPGNALVAYVGAASGGIWKTEDGGVHWRAVFDSQPCRRSARWRWRRRRTTCSGQARARPSSSARPRRWATGCIARPTRGVAGSTRGSTARDASRAS